MEDHFFKLRGKTIVCIDWANVYGWFRDLGWQIDPQRLFDYLRSHAEISDIRFYYGRDNNEKSGQFLQTIAKIGFSLVTKEVKMVPVVLDKSHFKKVISELKDVLDKAKAANSAISNKLYKLMKMIEDLPLPMMDYPEYHTTITAGEEQLDEIYGLIEELDGELKKINVDIVDLQTNLGKPVFRRKCDFDCELVIDIFERKESFDGLILFSGDGDYAAIVDKLIKMGKQAIVVFCKGHKGKEYEDFKTGLFLCSVDRLKGFLK
jgi:uncharacterized LabA/DUF88 family protein